MRVYLEQYNILWHKPTPTILTQQSNGLEAQFLRRDDRKKAFHFFLVHQKWGWLFTYFSIMATLLNAWESTTINKLTMDAFNIINILEDKWSPRWGSPKWSPLAGFIFAKFQPCNTACSRPFGAILPALLLFSTFGLCNVDLVFSDRPLRVNNQISDRHSTTHGWAQGYLSTILLLLT